MSFQPDAPKSKVPLIIAIVIGGGLLFCCFPIGAFVFWATTGPDGGVQFANSMDQYALDYLAEHQILDADEELVAYYDATIKLDSSEAAILTDKRVIYHKNSNNTALNLDDVDDWEWDESFGVILDIYGINDVNIHIEFAPLNNGMSWVNAFEDLVYDIDLPPTPSAGDEAQDETGE